MKTTIPSTLTGWSGERQWTEKPPNWVELMEDRERRTLARRLARRLPATHLKPPHRRNRHE